MFDHSPDQPQESRDIHMIRGKNSDAARAGLLLAGAQKHMPSVTSVTLGSVSYTSAQVGESLQAIVDLRAAVEDAKAATQAKMVAERARTPALRSLMTAFVAYVRTSYSNSPDVLADFGLKPKKAITPLTVEEKAAAVAKRAATRQARHTMGKNQKAAIHGTVPATAPAPSPTPTSAPAPKAAN
jgi:hypothetical protein